MLTADDVITWLTPIDIPAINIDSVGTQPGEQFVIDLRSPGAFTGGEGQMRTANFTISIRAASYDRMVELATAVEAVIPADYSGQGHWPAQDVHTTVKFVDFVGTAGAWQRRPIDSSERHCADAQFAATCAIT